MKNCQEEIEFVQLWIGFLCSKAFCKFVIALVIWSKRLSLKSDMGWASCQQEAPSTCFMIFSSRHTFLARDDHRSSEERFLLPDSNKTPKEKPSPLHLFTTTTPLSGHPLTFKYGAAKKNIRQEIFAQDGNSKRLLKEKFFFVEKSCWISSANESTTSAEIKIWISWTKKQVMWHHAKTNWFFGGKSWSEKFHCKMHLSRNGSARPDLIRLTLMISTYCIYIIHHLLINMFHSILPSNLLHFWWLQAKLSRHSLSKIGS